MVIVAGEGTIRPDRRAEMIVAASEMARASRAEPGCLAYHFSVSIEDPHRFYVYEVWESEQALALHFHQDHTLAFGRKLPYFVKGPIQVKRYSVSAEADL